MERYMAMKTNQKWMFIIVLVICMCGWCIPKALSDTKDSFQGKVAGVSYKSSPNGFSRTNETDTSVQNQSRPTVDLSALTFNTTFKEAIDILSNSTNPPLKIVVMWRDLKENAYVEPDTPIKIDGVSEIRLRMGLELVLKSVHSGFDELGYVVKGGVIIIATKPSLPSGMRTRVYDITDLVSQPARYNFGFRFAPGFGGGLFPGAYMGGRGQLALRGSTNTDAYSRRGRRRSGTGTIQTWGAGQRGRRADRLSGIIRDTVRPGGWR
jgi:hypothetical protein